MRASFERPPRFYIFCGNAAFNRGDRANLCSQIRILRDSFPECHITVDSFRPEVDRNWYPVVVIRRSFFLSFEQIRAILQADLVIWGGGALIADNSCMTLVPWWAMVACFVKLILRKPIVAWAHGVVLTTPIGRLMARIAYRQVSAIAVRDESSLSTLRKLLPGTAVKLSADPVVCFVPNLLGKNSSALPPPLTRSKVGICLTFWPFYHRSTDFLPFMIRRRLCFFQREQTQEPRLLVHNHSIIKIVSSLLADPKTDIQLFPRYPRKPWGDLECLSSIRARSSNPERVRIDEDDSQSPQEYYSQFRSVDFFITTAMHDAIVAISLGKPCLHLFYEDKGRDFFREIGAEDWLLDWNVLFEPNCVAKVEEKIAQIKCYQTERITEIQSRLSILKTRTKVNIEIVSSALSRTVPEVTVV